MKDLDLILVSYTIYKMHFVSSVKLKQNDSKQRLIKCHIESNLVILVFVVFY